MKKPSHIDRATDGELRMRGVPAIQRAARDDDRYFDLTSLSAYCGLSTKTLRRYMDDPEHPLPTHHVRSSENDRGRILIAKSAFDRWVQQFPPRRATKVARASTPMELKVAAAVRSIRGQ
jgi:hypothetical protein